MNILEDMKNVLAAGNIDTADMAAPYPDELYITVACGDFVKVCKLLHKTLGSPVMIFFAEPSGERSGSFALYCLFLNIKARSWVFVRQHIDKEAPKFDSLSKDIYSASLFEREMKEMFGIEPVGNPDPRSLRLHDEVWPKGYYPLRKDFTAPQGGPGENLRYRFKRVEGEGIFEVPVGPVHAGIIGPGHFRFSVAGEPIINLETRLGWKHRGIEKLLEGKDCSEALKIIECISGVTAFGYSTAFCQSVEKVLGIDPPARAKIIRVLCLELERLYNHANDMGGIALDVGFTFPAQFASLIKETILQLNEFLCGSRYLKSINVVGGAAIDIDRSKVGQIRETLVKIQKDLLDLEEMLFSSISFMDRVDTTGTLRTETARDLGVTGLAGRASGIALDMRKVLPGAYKGFSFNAAKEHSGDVAARLKVRCIETKESINMIEQCLEKFNGCGADTKSTGRVREGAALGCVEAWRGPVLIWTRLDAGGSIERCKIVDPSFHNWEALTFAVLGNIIPDFPLCNKSFDLSYSGNDL